MATQVGVPSDLESDFELRSLGGVNSTLIAPATNIADQDRYSPAEVLLRTIEAAQVCFSVTVLDLKD
jgi:hypothetical protein